MTMTITPVSEVGRLAALDRVDPGQQLRQAFSCFPTGVVAVGVLDPAGPRGMVMTSFTAVSIEPALVSVCLQRSSSTWPLLRHRPRLGVSVLAVDQAAVSNALASKSQDKFAGLAWRLGDGGALFIEGATGWFDCSLHGELPAGDHTIALLQVHRMWTDEHPTPLVFHDRRYRALA